MKVKLELKLIYTMFKLVTLSFILIEGLIIIEGRKTEELEADYIIILGARLYGYTPSPSLMERLTVAIHYLQDHPETKVVVSGGQGMGENVTEAYAMKKYLIDYGIDEVRIIQEDKSTSTFENLKYSFEKIKQLDSSSNLKILIASSKYHIFRSKLLAKRLGIKTYGLPAKVPPTTILKSYLREYFAVIKSILYDR